MTSEFDWIELRQLSIEPDGFGVERARIWIKLLGGVEETISSSTNVDQSTADTSIPHPDERQITLDTDRSFVLYPEVESSTGQDRSSLQSSLNSLLVDLFRKRPKLNYFQGFHDIATVFFLTLPSEVQLVSLEQMCLQRLRDSMGKTLEPVVGQLYVLKKLIQLVDLEYAEIMAESSPIPYFALSNLLTLFSHDVATLPLIQHVFDFLLCRPPVASVYLAAAVVLTRRTEAQRLREEDEEGQLHSLLSSLPNIYEEQTPQGLLADESTPDIALAQTHHTESITSALELVSIDDIEKQPPLVETLSGSAETQDGKLQMDDGPNVLPADALSTDIRDLKLSLLEENPMLSDTVDLEKPMLLETPTDKKASLVAELGDVAIYVPPSNDLYLDSPTDELSGGASSSPSVSLTALLRRADELYATYPPSLPELCIHEIFGPNSVIMTWSEDSSKLPSPDAAEAMVEAPELVSLGYEEPQAEPEEEDEDEEVREKPETHPPKRPRRRLKKRSFSMDRGLVIATAVLVAGAAIAYHMNGSPRDRPEWRKAQRWVGGLLLGAGEKLRVW